MKFKKKKKKKKMSVGWHVQPDMAQVGLMLVGGKVPARSSFGYLKSAHHDTSTISNPTC